MMFLISIIQESMQLETSRKKKIVLIGCGCVGATVAYTLTFSKYIREVILIDVNESLVLGEALDINSGSSYAGDVIVRVGDYSDCEDSAIIIITAGVNRKSNQTRDDLLEINTKIVDDILGKIKSHYKDSFIIMVTNPVDALTDVIAKSGFVSEDKFCGTGCMLDTARWVAELANYLGIAYSKVQAYSVGKHGSNQNVLWQNIKIDGKCIEEYCIDNSIILNEDMKEKLHEIVTNMGTSIIEKKGKTQYGIASSVAYLVNALLQNEDTCVSVGNLLNEFEEATRSSLVVARNGRIYQIE